MLGNSSKVNSILHEFDQLQQSSRKSSISRELLEGGQWYNVPKNRYSDVIPFDRSRVRLEDSSDSLESSGSDYINASHVRDVESDSHFIACQAPLPSTMTEFWTMVWEQQSSVIVMLTKLIEKQKIRANCYWPSQNGERLTFGPLAVTLLQSMSVHGLTIRTLQLERCDILSPLRTIYQLHYTSWPDFGVPPSTNGVLSLLQVMERCIDLSQSLGGPPIIHCSAGIGRAGTLIAIYIAQKYLRANTQCSIPSVVSCLRSQRRGMVQTKEQYMLIYRALHDWLEAMMTSVLDTAPSSVSDVSSPQGSSQYKCPEENIQREEEPPLATVSYLSSIMCEENSMDSDDGEPCGTPPSLASESKESVRSDEVQEMVICL